MSETSSLELVYQGHPRTVIIPHLTGMATMNLTGFEMRRVVSKVGDMPMGNFDQLVNYATKEVCGGTSADCSKDLKDYNAQLGFKPLFLSKESDTWTLGCGLRWYVECIAVWVKIKTESLKIYEIKSEDCVAIVNGKMITSQQELSEGRLKVNFFFQCTKLLAGKSFLGNASHLFLDSEYQLQLMANGYLSRENNQWYVNHHLVLDKKADKAFTFRSVFGYHYTPTHAVELSSFIRSDLTGLVTMVSDADLSLSNSIVNTPQCYAENPIHTMYVTDAVDGTAGIGFKINDQRMTCTLKCSWNSQSPTEVVCMHGFCRMPSDTVQCYLIRKRRNPKEEWMFIRLDGKAKEHFAKDDALEINEGEGSSDFIVTLYKVFDKGSTLIITLGMMAGVIYLMGSTQPLFAIGFAVLIWFYKPAIANPYEGEVLLAAMSVPTVVLQTFNPTVGFGQIFALFMTYRLLVNGEKNFFAYVSAILYGVGFPVLGLMVMYVLVAHYEMCVTVIDCFQEALEPYMCSGKIDNMYSFKEYLESANYGKIMSWMQYNLRSIGHLIEKYLMRPKSYNLEAKAVKLSVYWSNPLKAVRTKVLQSIYHDNYPSRRRGEIVRNRNVRNMKNLFFYESEYDLLQPVLIKLTTDEIFEVFNRKSTIAGREPFDLDFLNHLKWRSSLYKEIGSILAYDN